MYIAVDVERMCVVAKHADPRAVANLVFIENPYRVVNIHPYSGLAAYNIGQLFKLWCNTAGQDFPEGHNVVHACQALASHLPDCSAIATELDQQGAWLEADAEPYTPHQWQPGKRQPKPMPEGWRPDGLTVLLAGMSTTQISEILAGNILHEPAQAAYSARLEHSSRRS